MNQKHTNAVKYNDASTLFSFVDRMLSPDRQMLKLHPIQQRLAWIRVGERWLNAETRNIEHVGPTVI